MSTHVKAACFVLLVGLAAPGLAQPSGVTVETTRGSAVRLSALWGRPAVLFYEDKDGAAQNQPLKEELAAQGHARGLASAVNVIAVANVEGFDWFPAKSFVVSTVREAEEASGIPVYLDFHGALKLKPWALTGKGSTVAVVDQNGSLVFARNGPLSREEINHVVELLVRLVSR